MGMMQNPAAGTMSGPQPGMAPGGPPQGMVPPPGGPPGAPPGASPMQGQVPPEAMQQTPPDTNQGQQGDPQAQFEQVMADLSMSAFEQMDDQERKALSKVLAPEGSWVLAKIFGNLAITELKQAVATHQKAAAGPTDAAAAAPQSLMSGQQQATL